MSKNFYLAPYLALFLAAAIVKRMLLWFSGVCLILLLGGNLYHLFVQNIANADFFLLPNLCGDILSGHCHYFYWCLPPSRFLFPDALLYLPLRLIFHDGLLALFVEVCLFAGLLCLALAGAMSRLARVSLSRSLFPSLLSLALFSLPGTFLNGMQTGLFLPSIHGGAALMALLSWWAWLTCVGSRAKPKLLWVLLASTLAGFCDPLCFATFILPAAAATLLSPMKWRWKIILSVGLLLTGMLGSFLGDHARPLGLLQFTHQTLSFSGAFWHSLSRLLRCMALPEAFLGNLLFVIALVVAVWKSRPSRSNVHLWAAVLMAVMAPLIGGVLTGRFTDEENTRYCPLVFFAPLALLVWLAYGRFGKYLAYSAALFSLGTAAFLSLTHVPWSEVTYPSDARLFDRMHASLRLKSGLACYWQSTPLRYYSQRSAYLADLAEDSFPNCKLTSLAWMGLSYMPAPRREYNFIITHGLDKDTLMHLYGAPHAMCRVYFEKFAALIWLYDRDLSENLAREPWLIDFMALRLEKSGYFLGEEERSTLKQSLWKLHLQGPMRWQKL